MICVTGGTYIESCQESNWNELFGSGLRSAASLSILADEVQLHTFVSEEELLNLNANANTYHINLVIKKFYKTIYFKYFHSLSTPRIIPNIFGNETITVDGDVVLRFGFIEGSAIVSGNRVVYDPQSPTNPIPFSKNGSKADSLAIVANRIEILSLTQSHDFIDAGKILIEKGAEVVIVKHGAFGATVISKGGIFSIPVFQSPSVFPIGSGDIFSAIFTFYWGEKKLDPVEAAILSSKATAYYCNNRALPLPKNFTDLCDFTEMKINIDEVVHHPPQIYLAGPFFTISQRWLINEVRKYLLYQGIKVFSPYHDVGRGLANKVVPADINGINQSKLVFALVDGLDAGTLFEIGYARAKGLPVMVFVQNEGAGDLKMLEGSDCKIFNDLASAIYNTIWESLK